MLDNKKIKVLVFYVEADEELYKTMDLHLTILWRQKFIDSWQAVNIKDPNQYKSITELEMESIDLILMLISPDFLKSGYTKIPQVKKAVEMGKMGNTVLIPIILRECNWEKEDALFLQNPLPDGGKPIKNKHWYSEDEAFKNIVKALKGIVKEKYPQKFGDEDQENEVAILKREIEKLKRELEKLRKPLKIELGDNWQYMGEIDSKYSLVKLEKAVKRSIRKYNDFEPVFVLYTGGTVGMVRNNPLDPKSPIKTKKLKYVLPYLRRIDEIKCNIHFWELQEPLDSSNIGAEDWIELAGIIKKVYPYYQGFVILHGTDTMAYTASALSFMFINLAKPVILTGAEKPISEPVSDAEPNIVHSIQIAAYKAMDKPCVPEVCVFFGSKLLRGNRTKKIHSLALQGFDSPNCEALGVVEDGIDINQKILITTGSGKKLIIDDKLYPGVAIFEVYPNNRTCIETLKYILGLDHIQGLILKTYGTGNAPTVPEQFLSIIKEAIAKGKIIVNLTSCPKGQVQVRLFETHARLFEHGVINGGDLTVEAALCKLMWLLGPFKQTKLSLKQIEMTKARMQINFVGELRYSAHNLRESDVIIQKDIPFIGEEQPLQFFDNNAINHAYIRAQGIKVDGPPCDLELQFYYCFQALEQNPSDPKQLYHLIDSIPRRWDGQKEGITFNLDATMVVKKIREKERDAYHSISAVAKCDYPVNIKTLELSIFTENIRGVRSIGQP